MAEPRRIRSEELSKAIEHAVEIAKSKHKLELHPHPFQQDAIKIPWWIFGRVLRHKLDLDQAHKVSELITQQVNGKSNVFQPTTIRVGDDILCGFIERLHNQVELPDSLERGRPF